ncbi:MAG: cytochrome c oxidase subunit II [Micavibrio sp.]|nr:cytochrome c oxidase subunit II [Micavibrio sp.]
MSIPLVNALADDAATPTQLGLRAAATPQMERIIGFHNGLLILITIIVIFVTLLLAWVALRYNKKANPEPSKTTHNVPLEIVWTLLPALIVAIIAFPSFKMLYYLDRNDNIEMTLKVTGSQWYWSYEYPDHGGISFDSYMIPEDEIDESKGQKRLLSTDNPVVLPIDTNIALQITAKPTDVIHAFTVPAFGVKKDAVPGRMNETWVRIDKPGTYFGQCSEICGKDHSYMPIEIKAVTKEEFEKWLITAKEEFASLNDNTLIFAQYTHSNNGVQ